MADTEYRQNDLNTGSVNPSETARRDDLSDASKRNRGRDVSKQEAKDENRDPISGAHGAHPVGTGAGAAVGGAVLGTAGGVAGAVATGAAVGSAAGPVGAVVGAVIGGVAGGLAGKAIAEHVNPTIEHEYWRTNYASRSYVSPNSSYDDYGPAYQYGWEAQERHHGRNFQEVESDLRRDWEKARGKSRLEWDRAKNAVRDSWDRVSHRGTSKSSTAASERADSGPSYSS